METSLNYGAIKDTVIRKSASNLIKEENNIILKELKNKIANNPVLFAQNAVYNNFLNSKIIKKQRIAERFIHQNIKLMESFTWKEIMDSNKDFRNSLLGSPEEATVQAKNILIAKLYENIHTLIEAETNPKFMDIEKEGEAYDDLLAYLTREDETVEVSKEEDHPKFGKIWEYITKNSLNYFNERYSGLSDDDKAVLKIVMTEGDQRLSKVMELRENTLKLVDKHLQFSHDIETKDMFSAFKKKLEETKEKSEILKDEYIFYCGELFNKLKEVENKK